MNSCNNDSAGLTTNTHIFSAMCATAKVRFRTRGRSQIKVSNTRKNVVYLDSMSSFHIYRRRLQVLVSVCRPSVTRLAARRVRATSTSWCLMPTLMAAGPPKKCFLHEVIQCLRCTYGDYKDYLWIYTSIYHFKGIVCIK